MSFLSDGKFGLGLFSGIFVTIIIALAVNQAGIDSEILAGLVGILLGSTISSLTSFYTQWLSYRQIESERIREHQSRRSSLASNLHAKLLRSLAYARKINEQFAKNSSAADQAHDKRPSLSYPGIDPPISDLRISDDELYLGLEALKGSAKLEFLSIQDEYNELCRMSNYYTSLRREAVSRFLVLDPDGQIKLRFSPDQAAGLNASLRELDNLFNAILKRSNEVGDLLSKSILDVTEGFSRLADLKSQVMRMVAKRDQNEQVQ